MATQATATEKTIKACEFVTALRDLAHEFPIDPVAITDYYLEHDELLDTALFAIRAAQGVILKSGLRRNFK